MDSANNVVLFPIKNQRTPPITIEQVDENLDLVRQVHIQETLELVIPKLFENFSLAGFSPDDEDDEFMKHGAMVVESARSFLCKVIGIDHPLQLIAENLFDHNSDGSIEVSDKVKIVITPNEGKS
jgi:hypothetical protein